MRWIPYLLLILFNTVMTLIGWYWLRLLYWVMEGSIPVWLILGSFLLVTGIWICGNILVIRNGRIRAIPSILIIVLTVLMVYYEPTLMPRYKEFVDEKTMSQSFILLEYFKKGE
ncbi:hypothetical protein J45TS6_15100 [Paenibacillus sp. J45TS6]|uniref:hypothetical protein n=1 Tax=Paenibacillus sp. J45TS6 TaxID=2807196 RepID=UPI001B2D5EBF|nr:hypothetical protein [Paenibacillus sp. J45TS6]GIP43051.1 hypothetical protein J45TS6_15100 [Paenibacillus sp. J45TS6]